ncbi:hypothetical protein IBE76_10180 [Francisella tularensis]|nr:hypothetical protein [Francisella tularensis]MBK2239917.1 hypothetical protein [Francisella tularensis]MBK2242325.1 hypothetical protein [Francisella tularensis]
MFLSLITISRKHSQNDIATVTAEAQAISGSTEQLAQQSQDDDSVEA